MAVRNTMTRERGVWMVLDLMETGETNLINALNKLDVVDIERLVIIKNIEKFNIGEITLDELHEIINYSLKSVRK